MKSGDLPLEKLETAVRRVLTLKLKRGAFEQLAPRAQRLAALGGKRPISAKIATAAITLLRLDKKLYPLRHPKNVALITTEASLAAAIARRVPGVKTLVVAAYPSPQSMPALKQQVNTMAKEADVVIVSLVNTRQVELFNIAALSNKPLVAIVMGVPYLALQVPQASVILSTYSYRDSASEAAAASLFGEQGTPGKLPVAMRALPFGFGLNPVTRKVRQASLGSRPLTAVQP